jgi:hypothetical protein
VWIRKSGTLFMRHSCASYREGPQRNLRVFALVQIYMVFFERQKPVDQSAQRTRSGWKSKRIARARSVSNPKASIPLTYCAMLPGKIATKKSAVAMPTSRRRLSEIRQRPSAISTIPDAMTTKSGESGNQVGTCAWNSMRLVVRCRVPV